MKTKKDKNQTIFRLILVLFCFIMFLLTGHLNSDLNNMFSNYRIVFQSLKLPIFGVVIAPITEEIVKFVGYSIIFLFGMRFITKLNYSSKKKFRNDYLIIAFLISAGSFGFYEGVIHNSASGVMCFISFISLNTMVHITYSIYPYLLGRRYNNLFFLFLPIGMLLHSFHNLIIENVWDNKWVTFIMVTSLLLPIIL